MLLQIIPDKTKIKLITHTDLDGTACAVLAKLSANDVDVTYAEASDVDDVLLELISSDKASKYDYIIMTDLSVKREDTIALINLRLKDKFILIDHHKTGEELNKYDWATVQELGTPKPCATSLFAEALQVSNPKVKEFVELVRLFDVWDWVKENRVDAEDLDILQRALGKEAFVQAYTDYIKTGDKRLKSLFECIIKTKREKVKEQVEKDMNESFTFTVENMLCAAVLATRNNNEIASALQEKYPDADFTIKVNPATGTVSFRSREGKVDVSEIASFFGGGGHEHAAGVKLDTSSFKNTIIQIIKTYNKHNILGVCPECCNVITTAGVVPDRDIVECDNCSYPIKRSDYYFR